MRIVSSALSFCLLMLLYGCNDSYASTYKDFPIDTTDGIPVSVDTQPSSGSTTASTGSSVSAAETTQPTETEPTQAEPTESNTVIQEPNWREPDNGGDSIMSEKEWEEYEQDDPSSPGNNNNSEGAGGNNPESPGNEPVVVLCLPFRLPL